MNMTLALMAAHVAILILQGGILWFVVRIMDRARIDEATANAIQSQIDSLRRQNEAMLVDQRRHTRQMTENVQQFGQTLSVMSQQMANLLKKATPDDKSGKFHIES